MKLLPAALAALLIATTLFTNCRKKDERRFLGITDTLTLQPSDNPDEMYLSHTETTSGVVVNAEEFSAIAWTVDRDPLTLRSILKFDLSAIPENSRVLSAGLSLYANPHPHNGDLVHANSGPDNAMFISRINGDWSPEDLNWEHMPETNIDGQLAVPHTNDPQLDLPDMDVTTMVSNMLTYGNYGFMIQLQREERYNSRIFCSSKFGDAARHPKLTLIYQY